MSFVSLSRACAMEAGLEQEPYLSEAEEVIGEDLEEEEFLRARDDADELEGVVERIKASGATHAARGRMLAEMSRRAAEQLEGGAAHADIITIAPAQNSFGARRRDAKQYAIVPENAVPESVLEEWAIDSMERRHAIGDAETSGLLRTAASAMMRTEHLASVLKDHYHQKESPLELICASLAKHLDTLRLKAFSQTCKEVFLACRRYVHQRVEQHPDTTDPIHLLPEQRAVYDRVVRDGLSVYVHGEAGSGKTVTLRAIVAGLRARTTPRPRPAAAAAAAPPQGAAVVNRKTSVVVAAPTGTAADVCEGVTLAHLFGQLSTNRQYNDAAKSFPGNAYSGGNISLLCRMDVLIIDEISMVSWQDFDLMSSKLKALRKCSRPFGGVQLVCFGDFAQLPPVCPRDIAAKCPRLRDRCLNSPEFTAVFGNPWSIDTRTVVMLSCIVRQRDDETRLRQALRELRQYKPGEAVSELLRERHHHRLKELNDPAHSPKNLLLASDNKFVEEVNRSRINGLVSAGSEKQTYHRRWERGPNGCQFPAHVPESTMICQGAQVQLTRNALGCHLTNGSRGTCIGFVDLGERATWERLARSQSCSTPPSESYRPLFLLASDSLTIDTHSMRVSSPAWARGGARYPVVVFHRQPYTEYVVGFFTTPIKAPGSLEDEVLATYANVPLRIAYASTLHRCQGSTVEDNVTFNLSNCFEPEQIYVAFSRVKSVRQIVIAAPFNFARCYGPAVASALCKGTARLMEIFELRKQLEAIEREREAEQLRCIETGEVYPGSDPKLPRSLREMIKASFQRTVPRRSTTPIAEVIARMLDARERARQLRERRAEEKRLADERARLEAARAAREAEERRRREVEERLERERKTLRERRAVLEKQRAALAAAMNAEEGEEEAGERAGEGAAADVPARPVTGEKRKAADSSASDEYACKICYEAECNAVFVPCGHQVVCVDCANGLSSPKCPMCRAVISQVVRTYR